MAIASSKGWEFTVLPRGAHWAIVGATNRPTGAKTPGAYLLPRSRQSFAHSSSYTGTQWFSSVSHDRPNSLTGGSQRYYYFGAVAGTSDQRFRKRIHGPGFLSRSRVLLCGTPSSRLVVLTPPSRFVWQRYANVSVASEFAVIQVSTCGLGLFVGQGAKYRAWECCIQQTCISIMEGRLCLLGERNKRRGACRLGMGLLERVLESGEGWLVIWEGQEWRVLLLSLLSDWEVFPSELEVYNFEVIRTGIRGWFGSRIVEGDTGGLDSYLSIFITV